MPSGLGLAAIAVAASVAVLVGFAVRQKGRRQDLKFRHFALALGVFALIFAVGIVLRVHYQNAVFAPFEPFVDDYLVAAQDQAGTPYLKGRLIVVNPRTRELETFYFDLPQELQATQPGEVGTVVRLDCTSVTTVVRRVGGSTRNTVEYTCQMSLVDLAANKVVDRHTFAKTSGEEGYRDALGREMVAYLLALARR